MNEPTTSRQLASRRNTGKRKMSAYIAKVAEALSLPTHLVTTVPLDITDTVFGLFGARRQDAEKDCKETSRWCVTTSNRQDAYGTVRQFAATVPDVDVLLFRSESQWCGAITGRLHSVLARAEHLVERDQEDLLTCSRDGSTGVFAAWVSSEAAGTTTDIYKVICWRSVSAQ